MNKNSARDLIFKKLHFLILLPLFFSCENHRFDSDTRQIIGKNVIENQLHKAQFFDITGFKEDTLKQTQDSNFKKEIKYTLDIEYLDSNKVFQKKKGIVMFTPDGKSIINSEIADR